MKELCFECPLPPRGLSGNALHGYHWGSQATARKQHRTECELAAKAAMGSWKAPRRGKVSLLFALKDARLAQRYAPRDPTNAVMSVKSLIDGIVDAGVLEGDDFKHMELGEVRVTKEEGPFVRVKVEEVAVP